MRAPERMRLGLPTETLRSADPRFREAAAVVDATAAAATAAVNAPATAVNDYW